MNDDSELLSDWRYSGQDEEHKDAVWSWGPWRSNNPDNDHDHCEYCMTKFSARFPDTLNQGWHDQRCYLWICDPCFTLFGVHFNYKTVEEGAQPDAG